MLLGMAAATSALDLIKTLTQAGSASKPTSGAKFSAGHAPMTASAATPRAGQSGLIAPDTMNALLAAQSESDTLSSSATTARSAALSVQKPATAHQQRLVVKAASH